MYPLSLIKDLRYLELLAEMLLSLKYLGCENMREYQEGMNFIMKQQNKNVSFGDYERDRAYFNQQGIDINIKWYLHTTEVCLWALLTGEVTSELIIKPRISYGPLNVLVVI